MTSKLHYQTKGDPGGTPLIFINAYPLPCEMWEPQWSALPAGIFALRYDFRGIGRSALGPNSPTMDDHADDLIALLDELHLERAVWCGLSMGGYVLLRAWEKHARRARALVLCNTRSSADDEAGRKKRDDGIRKIREQGVAAYAEGFAPTMIAPRSREGRPDLYAALTRMVQAQSADGLAAALAAMKARRDTTASLAGISVPTLVIHSADDSVIAPAQAEAMAGLIPGSRYALLPDAGHLSNLENPDAFNRELFSFLGMLGNAAAAARFS